MIWILLNILILTVVYMMPSKNAISDLGERTIDRTKRKSICIVGSVGWILLSGLRHKSVGNDTVGYGNMFQRVESQSLSYLFERLIDKFFHGADDILDPGFFIFNKIMHLFTDNYQVYLVLFAILFFTIFGIFVYKFSSNPYISYVLFSCLFYSFYAFTGLRQTLATALVVCLGTICIKRRKLVPFLLLIAIGMTIHFSSLCFLPFYFISKIKINKATLIMWWGAIALSFAFRYQLLSVMQSIAGYDVYTDYEGAGAGTFMVLLIFLSAILTAFYFVIESNGNNEDLGMYANATFLACFFVPLSLINQSLMRIVHYFALFLMCVLPEMGYIFKKRTDHRVFEFAVVLVMVALCVMNNPTYKFFWQ